MKTNSTPYASCASRLTPRGGGFAALHATRHTLHALAVHDACSVKNGKAALVQREACCVKRRSKRAFTLIELLTVIAIIALLAGLLMPAVQNAREAAKKSKAKVFMSQLGSALTAYYNEYGYWPAASAYPTADAELTATQLQDLYQMLGGSNMYLNSSGIAGTGGLGGNPRQIAFFSYKSSDLGPVHNLSDASQYLKDTSTTTTNLVNAWGNSFRVGFDYDGNNQTMAPIPSGATAGITNNTSGFGIYTVGSKNNTWTWGNWQN